ncbi:MAG: hypothetical protein IIA45_04200 [Bacteroidetes bacterium]|nr:hypothetical protein [Bacteroidota bacterium]
MSDLHWTDNASILSGLFREESKKIKGLDLITLTVNGVANFDYTAISEKILIIPKYDPKSTYSDVVLGKQYDGLSTKAKNEYYEEIWNKGIEESSFSQCEYEIRDVNFERLSRAEKKEYLYFSYHQLRGYYYAYMWYVDEKGKEYPAVGVVINDLDLGSKNDIRFLFNILNQAILMNQDFSYKKMFGDGDFKAKTLIEQRYSMETQDVVDATNEYFASLVANYLSEADDMILVIPEERRTKGLDKVMEDWTYSKYEYWSEEEIEDKREKLDPEYCYLRFQTMGKGLLRLTTVYILSTENDRILYQCFRPFSAEDKLEGVVPILIEDIESKRGTFDPNSTIAHKRVEFISDELPLDLQKSIIGYVNLTKQQYFYAKPINESFERKMKKYPLEYKIVDNVEDLSDCDYRVMLKSYMQTFKKITTTKYTDGRRPDDVDVDYVVKELFMLYLEDVDTGEAYKFQAEPDFYFDTFKAFVKEVKYLYKE